MTHSCRLVLLYRRMFSKQLSPASPAALLGSSSSTWYLHVKEAIHGDLETLKTLGRQRILFLLFCW